MAVTRLDDFDIGPDCNRRPITGKVQDEPIRIEVRRDCVVPTKDDDRVVAASEVDGIRATGNHVRVTVVGTKPAIDRVGTAEEEEPVVSISISKETVGATVTRGGHGRVSARGENIVGTDSTQHKRAELRILEEVGCVACLLLPGIQDDAADFARLDRVRCRIDLEDVVVAHLVHFD